MSIFDEVQQLEHLTVYGKSLVKYANSLEPGLVFTRRDGWWIPADERRFIGFRFQWTNLVSITLRLFGAPQEHLIQDDLMIKKSKSGYSECRVTDEDQLMAATVSIWRAHQLFHRGRSRKPGALFLMDENATIKSGPKNWLRPRPVERIDGDDTTTLVETHEWYNEVREFMKKNKLIDSSIVA